MELQKATRNGENVEPKKYHTSPLEPNCRTYSTVRTQKRNKPHHSNPNSHIAKWPTRHVTDNSRDPRRPALKNLSTAVACKYKNKKSTHTAV